MRLALSAAPARTFVLLDGRYWIVWAPNQHKRREDSYAWRDGDDASDGRVPERVYWLLRRDEWPTPFELVLKTSPVARTRSGCRCSACGFTGGARR